MKNMKVNPNKWAYNRYFTRSNEILGGRFGIKETFNKEACERDREKLFLIPRGEEISEETVLGEISSPLLQSQRLETKCVILFFLA